MGCPNGGDPVACPFRCTKRFNWWFISVWIHESDPLGHVETLL